MALTPSLGVCMWGDPRPKSHLWRGGCDTHGANAGRVWAGSGHPCEGGFGVARNWSEFSPLTEGDAFMKCKDLSLLLTRRFVSLQLLPEPRFADREI